MYDILQMITIGIGTFIIGAFAGAVFASYAESWDAISYLAVTAQKASKNIKKAAKQEIKNELRHVLQNINDKSFAGKISYECFVRHPKNVNALKRKGFNLEEKHTNGYYEITWKEN